MTLLNQIKKYSNDQDIVFSDETLSDAEIRTKGM